MIRSACLALAPVCLVVALLSVPHSTLSADRRAPVVALSRDLLFSRGLVTRRLRADFESPDLLVLAYDSDWEPSLRQILRATGEGTQVALVPVREDAHRRSFRELSRRPGVIALDGVLDTSWVRDFAPLQLRDESGQVYWYDFPYTDERPEDDAFPERIAERWQARYERGWFPMDGGGIISNGEGLCAITEVTLSETTLAPTSRADASVLLGELGCDVLVVLPALPNEDTGHVDMMAQFVAPTSLIISAADQTFYPEVATVLDEVAQRFAKVARRLRMPLSITRVPYEVNGAQHYTYVNGTALKGMFLVPHYDLASRRVEKAAYDALQRAMPDRKLVKVDADAMIERGGSVHCITAGLNLESGRAGEPATLPDLAESLNQLL